MFHYTVLKEKAKYLITVKENIPLCGSKFDQDYV